MQKPNCIAILLAFVSFSTSAQFPIGSVARYLLNNSPVDASANGYGGTLTSTSATSNRFGSAASATAFTSGISTGTLPGGLVTAMQNDFSIGYWFKTSMTASSSSQWYGGNALVDAEVCGGTQDWGTALIDGGKVCMGIGNPDITIKTPLTYNDGNWHFVTAVRNKAAGSIELYIDGLSKVSTTGTSTLSLNAAGFIGLGRNFCSGSALFTGSLDDIVAFNRVLSGAEVLNLYNYMAAQALPLHWLVFSGQSQTNGIQLKWEIADAVNSDHFEIEHSKDGRSFNMIGSLPDNAGHVMAGKTVYHYLHVSPLNGNHFYRIKQVDIDGRYSYSTVVRLSLQQLSSGFSLKNNPVQGLLVLLNPNQQIVNELLIIDGAGKLMLRRKVNTTTVSIQTDIQTLPAGHYFLRVIVNDGGSGILSFLK